MRRLRYGFCHNKIRIYDWPNRVTGKNVLDIGQKQFLVLLLMIQTKLNECRDLRISPCVVEQFVDGGIDVSPVIHDLFDQWPCQQSALGALMHLTGSVIIGIEQVMIVIIEALIVTQMGYEHEALEKPGRVRHVPLGRAYIRHALYDIVLWRQVSAQR